MTKYVQDLTRNQQFELTTSREWVMAAGDLRTLIESNPEMQERYQMQFDGVEEMIARQLFPPEKKHGRR